MRRATFGTSRRGRALLPVVASISLLVVGCQPVGLPSLDPDPFGVARAPDPTASPGAEQDATARVLGLAAPAREAKLRADPPPRLFAKPPARVAPAVAAALEAQLERAFEGEDMPGVSLAVRFSDGSVWSGARGVAALEGSVPLSTGTMFNVASITKPFIAALTMDLAEDGLVSLDDPVSKWLDDIPHGDLITVRQLLGHTSGIRDYFADDASLIAGLLDDPDRLWTPAEVLDHVGVPYWEPGGGWAYSNSNYLLLGLILQRVTDGTVGEAMRARLLDPLELEHTFLQPDEVPVGMLADGHTRTYDDDRDGMPDSTSNGGPFRPDTAWASSVWTAGAMVSTPSDLVRWGDALFDGRVLEDASLQQMLRFNSDDYGLGVQRERLSGELSWGHSGLLRGFTGLLLHYPEADVTVAVLTNQDRVPVDDIVSDRYGAARSIIEIALADTDQSD